MQAFKERLSNCCMSIYIEGNPEFSKKEILGEGEYYEIEWQLNESPSPAWDSEFEKLLKPWLEKNNDLFGPYKPKILSSILITFLLDISKLEEQKKFFEDNFFSKIKSK